MSTWRLTNNGDLDITSKTLVLVTGAEACATQLRARFDLFLGEWFLDTRIGIPYFERVLVKNPDTGPIAQMFRRVILSTPGVKEITEFALDYDPARRVLAFTFAAKHDTGAIITGGQGVPFIVEQTT